MDPQGRLLLEQSGLALASSEAEKSFSSAEQVVGVYIGVMHMEYIQFMSGKQRNTLLQTYDLFKDDNACSSLNLTL